MTNDVTPKNKSSYILFLILPLILFVSAVMLKDVQGPYYLFFYDPSYVYLINSLNLAQLSGYGVGHFDHPGTTVQIIGAAAVKIYHAFRNSGFELTEDVLTNPESYLLVLNRTFVTLNCLLLFAVGILIFKITKNKIIALTVQLSPFASVEIFFGLIIVTPENFLIFVCLLFVSAVFYYLYYNKDKADTTIHFTFLFALICGLGLATKINYLPLLILPVIILKGFKQKAAFAFLTFVFFIMFILPGLNNVNYFINWISDLIIKSGKYGKGEASVFNSGQFYKNIYAIFKKDFVFTVAFVTTLFTLISLIKSKAESGSFEFRLKKILLSLMLIFIIQIVMVAKHYSQYYMIPSFMLSVPAVVISIIALIHNKRLNFEKIKFEYIFGIIFTVILSWSMYMIISSYFEGYSQRKDAEKMIEVIEEKKQEGIFVSSFGSSGRETALAFASQYGAGQSKRYKQFLSGKFKSKLFYNQWTDKFFTLSENDDIKKTLLSNPVIILQLSHYGSLQNFLKTLKSVCGTENIKHEKIFGNQKMETLYKIVVNN